MSESLVFATGEKALQSGVYEFMMYTDNTALPSHTSEERYIRLEKGERFPPVRSCNKGAYWIFRGVQ